MGVGDQLRQLIWNPGQGMAKRNAPVALRWRAWVSRGIVPHEDTSRRPRRWGNGRAVI